MILETASFALSGAEAVAGMYLILTGVGSVPGVLLTSHGLYGMANSTIGIINALNEANTPGAGEIIGGAVCGEAGANIGATADFTSNLSGGVKGLKEIASSKTFRDAIEPIIDAVSGANSAKDNFGNK